MTSTCKYRKLEYMGPYIVFKVFMFNVDKVGGLLQRILSVKIYVNSGNSILTYS